MVALSGKTADLSERRWTVQRARVTSTSVSKDIFPTCVGPPLLRLQTDLVCARRYDRPPRLSRTRRLGQKTLDSRRVLCPNLAVAARASPRQCEISILVSSVKVGELPRIEVFAVRPISKGRWRRGQILFNHGHRSAWRSRCPAADPGSSPRRLCRPCPAE